MEVTQKKGCLFVLFKAVGLTALAPKLEAIEPWAQQLSLGEQQRLAFARVLLQRSTYLFLDEASSALDEPAEQTLYRQLAEALPDTAIVSVGHRSTLREFHDHRLKLRGGGAWSGDVAIAPAAVPRSALI